MPSRSSSLMSDASVNRAGGVVSCRFGSMPSSAIARARRRGGCDRRPCTAAGSLPAPRAPPPDRRCLRRRRGGSRQTRSPCRWPSARRSRRPALRRDLDASSAARARPPSATPSSASRSARRSCSSSASSTPSSWLGASRKSVGPDRLVRFLRVLHPRLVAARRRRSTRRRTSRG